MGRRRHEPVKVGDCLLTRRPYQRTVHEGVRMKAHRRAFLIHNGYLPEVVQHSCDNPRCVNPEHLIAGDFASNNQDRAKKGRSAKVVPSRRKFCRDKAVRLYRYGFSFKAIAELLGVSYGGSFVRDVRRGIVSSD